MPYSVRQNSRRSGFSLIELVMVTAILAIVASIAVPRYAASLHRYRADAAARHIVAEVMRARAIARQTSDTFRVQFDLPQHRLLLPDTPGDHDTPPTVWLNRNPYQARLVAVNFDSSATLSFDGHGRPAAGGTITLRSGQTLRTITVHPVSGHARVEP